LEISPYTVIGFLLILLGVLFVALPYLRGVVDFDKIPWYLIWVYRSDGFTFATSPILIIISLLSIIVAYMRH